MLVFSETVRTVLLVFVIAAAGYALGAVRIRGVSLGSSAIFLTGLLFGHFGVTLPPVLQTAGIVLFISAVGLSAGPSFADNLRRSGKAYILLSVLTILSGALVCMAVIHLAGVEAPIAMGLMTGAYTSSPGFASAKDAVAASADAVAKVAAGYGILYPVGTLGKVLFVQLMPKLLHADMDAERRCICRDKAAAPKAAAARFRVDSLGMFPLALAIGGGIVLGSVTLPVPGVGGVSLGVAGGPLLAGLLLGHVGRVGPVDLRPAPGLIGPVKELGLVLFFSGAGTEGGSRLAEVLGTYGASLLVYGLVLLAVPLLLGTLFALRVLKLPLLSALAAMTGGMTCSASLAALIETAGTDDVASTYATIYPISLLGMVFIMQVLGRM